MSATGLQALPTVSQEHGRRNKWLDFSGHAETHHPSIGVFSPLRNSRAARDVDRKEVRYEPPI